VASRVPAVLDRESSLENQAGGGLAPQNSASRNSPGTTSLRAIISYAATNESSSTRAQNLLW
jgi:hypothetical protein